MGYGFVEFSNHEDALSALRATNNNPAIFGMAKVRVETCSWRESCHCVGHEKVEVVSFCRSR